MDRDKTPRQPATPPSDPPSVNRTPASLLARLRHRPTQTDWSRFVRIYGPLMLAWAQRAGLGDQADDLVQDVFVVLIDKLRTFRYDPKRKFRGFLNKLLHDKRIDLLRKKGPQFAAMGGVDPIDPGPAFLEGEVDIRQLVERTLIALAGEFACREMNAFREHVLKQRTLKEVAAELGMSIAAVYRAKEEVLKRLREELDGQLD